MTPVACLGDTYCVCWHRHGIGSCNQQVEINQFRLGGHGARGIPQHQLRSFCLYISISHIVELDVNVETDHTDCIVYPFSVNDIDREVQ